MHTLEVPLSQTIELWLFKYAVNSLRILSCLVESNFCSVRDYLHRLPISDPFNQLKKEQHMLTDQINIAKGQAMVWKLITSSFVDYQMHGKATAPPDIKLQ